MVVFVLLVKKKGVDDGWVSSHEKEEKSINHS